MSSTSSSSSSRSHKRQRCEVSSSSTLIVGGGNSTVGASGASRACKDVLHCIFRFLALNDMALSLSSVSKHWNFACNTLSSLKVAFQLQPCSDARREAQFIRLIRSPLCHHIVNLTTDNVSLLELDNIAHNMPQLRWLRTEIHYISASPPHISFPLNLKALDFTFISKAVQVTHFVNPLRHLSSLTSLSLRVKTEEFQDWYDNGGNDWPELPSVFEPLTLLKNITHLALCINNAFTSLSFADRDFIAGINSITSLNIASDEMHQTWINLLKHESFRTQLKATQAEQDDFFVDDSNDGMFSWLISCSSLTAIDFSPELLFDDFHRLSQLPNLSKVRLLLNARIDVQLVVPTLANLRLRELYLCHPRLNDDFIQRILSKQTQLRVLQLTMRPHICIVCRVTSSGPCQHQRSYYEQRPEHQTTQISSLSFLTSVRSLADTLEILYLPQFRTIPIDQLHHVVKLRSLKDFYCDHSFVSPLDEIHKSFLHQNIPKLKMDRTWFTCQCQACALLRQANA